MKPASKDLVVCNNGHRVNIGAIHEDGTCLFCGDFVWLPRMVDIRNMQLWEVLYFPFDKSNVISGMANAIKKKTGQEYKIYLGTIQRTK